MSWIKTGRQVIEGGSTTTYELEGHPEIRVESRKRQIPHASRGGTWVYTSFVLLVNGEQVGSEQHRLSDAQRLGEELAEEVKQA